MAAADSGTVSTVRGDLDAAVDVATQRYRDLHSHPELSGRESRTAQCLADWLEDAGFETTAGVGGCGVVGVLRNGVGPTVMLRAELDALPVRETTGLPYASREVAVEADGRVQPVMHACGHDAHLASAAGAASWLAERRDGWRGTVMVIGQPAEETLTGAAAMLDDGLYSRWRRPDVVLAQHLAPLPAGMVAHATGAVTAASASIEVVVHGRGGHAATAHLTVNPVTIAASVVLALSEVPSIPGVIRTVGAVNAGVRGNVVPDRAAILLGLRSLDEPALAAGIAEVERIVAGADGVTACPLPPEVTVSSRSSTNVNDSRLAAVVRHAHESAFAAGRVIGLPPSMATEDFALFGQAGAERYGGPAVPTVYWMIGATGARQWAEAPGDSAIAKMAALPVNHAPDFAPDPLPTLRTGIIALVTATLACLEALDAPGRDVGA